MSNLPSPLPEILNHSLAELKKNLAQFFKNAEDALQELIANESDLDDSQGLKESIDAIFQQRPDVEKKITESFCQAFEKPVEQKRVIKSLNALNLDKLSLLDDEQVEFELASSRSIRSAAQKNSQTLCLLAEGFNTIYESAAFDEDNLPWASKFLVDCFSRHLHLNDLPFNLRLSLLDLFCKEVVFKLNASLRHAKQVLNNRGISTGSSRGKAKPVASDYKKPKENDASAANQGNHSSEASGDALERIDILSQQVSSLGEQALPQHQLPNSGQVASPYQQTEMSQMLNQQMKALSQLQVPNSIPNSGQAPSPYQQMEMSQMLNQQMAPFHQLINNQGIAPLRHMLQAGRDQSLDNIQSFNVEPKLGFGQKRKELSDEELMQILHGLQNQAGSQSLDQSELKNEIQNVLEDKNQGEFHVVVNQHQEDVLNLLNLLFDFVVSDDYVPEELKNKITSLQVPLTKVAIQDEGFFKDTSHPARVLLNELSRVAMSWPGLSKDRQKDYSQHINECVDNILAKFEDDQGVIADTLKTFLAYKAKEDERSALLERRTQELEFGKAKREEAELIVKKLITGQLAGNAYPREAHQFLEKVWFRLMHITVLREGKNSKRFKQEKKLLETFVESCRFALKAFKQGKRMRRPEKLIDLMIKRLSSELYSRQEAKEFRNNISSIYKIIAVGEFTPVKIENDELDGESQGNQAKSEDIEKSPWWPMVDGLQLGAWVEFKFEDNKRVRCKVVANIKSIDKMVFVNRAGVKVCERKRKELIDELEDGKAKLMNDKAIFDQALESVIISLRKPDENA